MAALGQTYQTADLPQGNGGDFSPIPEGLYSASITQADLAPTKQGGGQYIKLRLDITGPTHQGRVIFSNINIRNANPKAEEIGLQQLGDIARAIGLASISDTDQLIGADLQIKVAIRPANDEYPAQNEVKSYKAASGAGGTFASTFKSPPPPPAASGGLPWQQKAAATQANDGDTFQ